MKLKEPSPKDMAQRLTVTARELHEPYYITQADSLAGVDLSLDVEADRIRSIIQKVLPAKFVKSPSQQYRRQQSLDIASGDSMRGGLLAKILSPTAMFAN